VFQIVLWGEIKCVRASNGNYCSLFFIRPLRDLRFACMQYATITKRKMHMIRYVLLSADVIV